MVESFGKFKKLFEGEIIDERKTTVENLLRKYPMPKYSTKGFRRHVPLRYH